VLCDFEGSGEGDTDFQQLGVNLTLLGPGEPMAMYHWEADQEDFLVLSGEALLIIEGEERTLRQWDFVHCPPGTNHTIVGAGSSPCLVLAVGARDRRKEEEWGAYTVDAAALRHGAGVEQETTSGAYARFPPSKPTRYGDGWLPASDAQTQPHTESGRFAGEDRIIAPHRSRACRTGAEWDPPLREQRRRYGHRG
jgi:uncharacterized cupin superfamily protein